MKRKFFYLLAGCSLVIGSYYLYRWGDRQFRYENIALDASFFPALPEMPPSSETLSILNQPFYYLDSGKQSFAFVSEDGRYVLKFFDRSRFRQWRNQARARVKMEQAVNGYITADVYDRDHVGLLYMHRTSQENHLPSVVITDRFGLHHQIDLNRVPFVLQKKAVPTRIVIATFLDRRDCSAARKAFASLKAMYVDEHQRGIYDLDRNLMHNTGFVGEVPMRIDAGRLTIDERLKDPVASRNELQTLQKKRIDSWLKRHSYCLDP